MVYASWPRYSKVYATPSQRFCTRFLSKIFNQLEESSCSWEAAALRHAQRKILVPRDLILILCNYLRAFATSGSVAFFISSDARCPAASIYWAQQLVSAITTMPLKRNFIARVAESQLGCHQSGSLQNCLPLLTLLLLSSWPVLGSTSRVRHGQ